MLFLKISAFLLVLNGFVVKSAEINESDELADFEFESQPSNDDYFYADEINAAESLEKEPLDDFFDDFNDESEFLSKEQKLKQIMLKALSNKGMKRKFSEILPILRMMNTPQRMTMAALISSQAVASPGKELDLEMVKEMFGNRRELILPISLDIANLVKSAGTDTKLKIEENEEIPNQQILRRSLKPMTKEDIESMEEVAKTETPEVYYSHLKEEQLEIDESDGFTIKNSSKPIEDESSRKERSFLISRTPQTPPRYHERKLNMTLPLVRSFHERKLNMTDFGGDGDQLAQSSSSDDSFDTKNLTLEQIEDLSLSELNGTFLENINLSEDLPTPEMLVGGRYRKRPLPVAAMYNFKKRPVFGSFEERKNGCERFTGNVCLQVDEYPMDQIMGSIRRHRHAMTALLAEYRDNRHEFEDEDTYNPKRREDDPAPGGMCPTIVRYARPQKAKSATGEWKYIVNTGQHSQTLRLEKCSQPQESCTYLTDNFRSRCIQIFNYHRLLSWDKTRGLHVDIFKVPTCCSCHIDGYREAFPPLSLNDYKHPQIGNDFRTSSSQNHKTYKFPALSTIADNNNSEEEEEESNDAEEDDEDEYAGYKIPSYGQIAHSASNTKTRYENRIKPSQQFPTASTVGSYLSPPSTQYDTITFKRGPQISITKRKRRPIRHDQTASTSSKVHEVYSSNADLTTVKPSFDLDDSESENKNTNVRIPERINYNYHPIIDFFEEDKDEKSIEDRRGLRNEQKQSKWKPIVSRRQ